MHNPLSFLGQKTFIRYYSKVVKSIAFFPILICIGFTILTFIMLSVEKNDMAADLKEKISYLLISDVDTARTLMSALIGGVFTLTVFSFSMVMVVLNQASTSFSPRLLPGLISNKKHQVILGVFIGTLLYFIIILIYVKSTENTESNLGLSLFVASILGILCLAFFVFFIHSISQSIQIHNIIKKINRYAQESIQNLLEEQESYDGKTLSLEDGAPVIRSNRSGYFQGIKRDVLEEVFEDKKIGIQMIPAYNQFVWEGKPIAKTPKVLDREETDIFLSTLDIRIDRHSNGGYFAELIKLKEICVKAMSPGINDPGTAIGSLDALGSLMREVKKLEPSVLIRQGTTEITVRQLDMKLLLNDVFKQIRLYAKKDPIVMEKLADIFKVLVSDEQLNADYQRAFEKTLQKLQDDIENNVDNQADQEEIIEVIES
ncbi:DUF2254 domain-containing protein [Pricia sp.]|uniref:DUF2254 domain-containing protein n=1 Tax=Pricia sp. TaxID=2268138 RepID=UPI003593828E